jgi:hypothetical protein
MKFEITSPGARIVPTCSGCIMLEDAGFIQARLWLATRCGWGTIRISRFRRPIRSSRTLPTCCKSTTTTANNQITTAESKQIRARREELKSVTEGFVACCKEGNFGAMKKEAARRKAAK